MLAWMNDLFKSIVKQKKKKKNWRALANKAIFLCILLYSGIGNQKKKKVNSSTTKPSEYKICK